MSSPRAEARANRLPNSAAVLPENLRDRANSVQVHALDWTGPDPDTRAMLDQLEMASEDRTRLILDYADAEGRRTSRPVRPLGLWFWGKVWTLIAWCELREDFRMFRVDRIASAKQDGTFRPERGKTLRDFYDHQS